MMLHKNLLQMIIANWLNSDKVIIDTETTGLTYGAEIIEISVIDMKGNVLLDTLVKPSCSIPPEATEINRITDEMVADAPSWREVYPVLMDIIGARKWVGWKSEFDARLMVQSCLINGLYDDLSPAQLLAEHERIHGSQIDAKRTYSEWYGEPDRERGGFKRQHLAAAVRQMGVKFQGNAHRSLADCYAVLHVLIRASKWVAPETMTMAQIRNSLPIVARFETTAGQALFDAVEEQLFHSHQAERHKDDFTYGAVMSQVALYEKIQMLASEVYRFACAFGIGQKRTEFFAVYSVLNNLTRRGYAQQVGKAMNPLLACSCQDNEEEEG